MHWTLVSLYLVFGVSFPLSAEAVIKFGPVHIPIATKGYENLFVALANRIRVDGSTLCSWSLVSIRYFHSPGGLRWWLCSENCGYRFLNKESGIAILN